MLVNYLLARQWEFFGRSGVLIYTKEALGSSCVALMNELRTGVRVKTDRNRMVGLVWSESAFRRLSMLGPCDVTELDEILLQLPCHAHLPPYCQESSHQIRSLTQVPASQVLTSDIRHLHSLLHAIFTKLRSRRLDSRAIPIAPTSIPKTTDLNLNNVITATTSPSGGNPATCNSPTRRRG